MKGMKKFCIYKTLNLFADNSINMMTFARFSMVLISAHVERLSVSSKKF